MVFLGAEHHLLIDGLLVFLIGQHGGTVGTLLFMHHLQDHQLTFAVVFRIGEGVPFGGVLGDCDERSCFGRRQLRDIFSKIKVGSRLNAVLAVAQCDGVEVYLKNLLLGVVFLQVDCPENFPHLSANVKFLVVGYILDNLLGDG